MEDNQSRQAAPSEPSAGPELAITSLQLSAEPALPREHLQAIIDTIPTLAWSAGAEGAPEFFNRQWLDYTGLTLSDALAGKWRDTIHPADWSSLLGKWSETLKSGKPLELELRQRRFDGEYRWFLVRANPLRGPSGSVIRWYGTNTDIDDWRHVQLSSEAIAREFRQIFDSLPALVYTQTPEGRTDLVSKPLLEYFGRPAEELRDWANNDVVHPDDLERAFREIAPALAAGEPYSLDVRLRRWDGVYRWFQCRHIPLRDASGRITRWYGLGADIDDFKRAAVALRESEQTWRLIVDNIPGLVYTMTPDCRLELVNRKLLEYFGRTFDELMQWDRIGAVHPDDMPRVLESLRRCVELGEPHEVEQRLRRGDGVYRWFKPRALPMRDGDGHIVRWYCLLSDVDDLRRAEESLRGTQERLNRAARLATVSELSAAIAHEINQPLAAVVTNGHACRHWLTGETPNIERALRSADMIVRDGNAAAEVIQRMRSLFKREPLAKEDGLQLNGVIDEVCSLMADDVRSNGVQLEMQLATSPVHVSADRVQLQQVLVNLLRNGIESMSAVTDRPRRLTVASVPSGDEVWVLVMDQGAGIDDPNAVFESFYSTKPHGLGMGLSICRSIIDAHGGRLWAERNEPHGSVFGFALPIDSGITEHSPPPS